MIARCMLALAIGMALATAIARAEPLPAQLAPAAPFPTILSQAPSTQPIAPGVTYGAYRLQTSLGPEAIHIVAIEAGGRDIRIGAMLANDRLSSNGESVVSMAQRSGAIAGINGDYFDIGQSNRPTNIVVDRGALVRTPRERSALVVLDNGTATISPESFLGQITLPGKTIALDAVDTLAASGGVTLLTPQYGRVAPIPNLTLVGLALVDGSPPFATYRVTGILDNSQMQPPGYYLAIGIDAYTNAGVPNVGETIAASGDLSPVPLASIAAAVGGGPTILANGEWFNDPNGPNGPDYSARIPCSGATIAADGTLFLIEVDGRQPLESVGITRPEFAALMKSLGGVTGMAFDGGGSSGMAVQLLGEDRATAQGSPSDGQERRVADGLFVYNTAPVGPPARIIARPSSLHVLAGATLAFTPATVDQADHAVAPPDPIAVSIEPASLATYRNGQIEALRTGIGTVHMRSGALATTLPLEVDPYPARVLITPPSPNVARGQTIALSAHAYDARGFVLALPADLSWRASSGAIDAHGAFTAGPHDAVVSVALGNRRYRTFVTVGSHSVPLDFAAHASFLALPRGGSGSVVRDPTCPMCVQLTFALGPSERAAYAMGDLALPTGTTGLSFEVRDDGSGALLKIALRNAINEQVLLLATRLDRPGWRHVSVRFPSALGKEARLVGLYAIAPNPLQSIGGSIVLRDVRAIVAGSTR